MSNFKNFFHKELFYFSDEEKANLTALKNTFIKDNNYVFGIVTRSGDNGSALCILKDAAVPFKTKLENDDIVSALMIGKKSRLTQIKKKFDKMDRTEIIKFINDFNVNLIKPEKAKREKPDKPILKKVVKDEVV